MRGEGKRWRQWVTETVKCEVSGLEGEKRARVTEAKVRNWSKRRGAAGGKKGGLGNGERGARTQLTGRQANRVHSQAQGGPALPSMRARGAPLQPSPGPCPPRCCGAGSSSYAPILSPPRPTPRSWACGRPAPTLRPPAPRSGRGGEAHRQRQARPLQSAPRAPVSRRAGAGPGAGHCGKGVEGSAWEDAAGLGCAAAAGWGGRFRLTWRSARNPAPAPTRS